MRRLLTFLFIVVCLVSCSPLTKTVYLEVPVPVTHIEYRDRILHDSIYVRDSIFTSLINDTIYIYKEKYCTKYINKTDTIIKQDTVPVILNTTEVKEINVLKSWQRDLMTVGTFAILFMIICVMYYIKKLF